MCKQAQEQKNFKEMGQLWRNSRTSVSLSLVALCAPFGFVYQVPGELWPSESISQSAVLRRMTDFIFGYFWEVGTHTRKTQHS